MNEYKYLLSQVGSDSTEGDTPIRSQSHEGALDPVDSALGFYRYFQQEIKDGAHVIILVMVFLYLVSRQAVGKAWESHHNLVKTTTETSLQNAERLKNLEAQTLTQNLRLDSLLEDLGDIEELIKSKNRGEQ